MHKYLMETAVFFILMFSVFSAHAITATEMIHERIKTATSPSELTKLIKQLPPLTPGEIAKAKQFIAKSRLHSDLCSKPSCYPKCMLSANAAICCKGTVCVGGDCDFGKCIGDPSRGNEFASLACGIKCL